MSTFFHAIIVNQEITAFRRWLTKTHRKKVEMLIVVKRLDREKQQECSNDCQPQHKDIRCNI